MDAETGESAWRYYTIPAPGQPGGDSWPEGTDAYLRGGGAVWQAPAYDPELGLLYFSTGNAGPDWDGSVRAGDNKWAVSIVAVEADTGTFKWGYQMVHHDIWDLDAASPVVLFDAGRTTARAWRRPARPAGSTCSTARRASRSTGSTRSP